MALYFNTYRLGLLVFLNSLVRRIGEVHIRSQFRDNKVAGSKPQQFSNQIITTQHNNTTVAISVGIRRHHHLLVGVKPLGHLHSRHGSITSGHGEVGVKTNLTTGPAIPLWDGTEGGGGIKHLIIVRESVAGDILDPSRSHLLPDGCPEINSYLLQILGAALAIPERFESELELPLGTHAGVSDDMRCHCSVRTDQNPNQLLLLPTPKPTIP